jgi:hypothetical protein
MEAILARDNQLYRDELMSAFSDISPGLTRQQQAVLARFVQVLVDGLSLQLMTDDPSSRQMKSLVRLLRVVIVTVFDDLETTRSFR